MLRPIILCCAANIYSMNFTKTPTQQSVNPLQLVHANQLTAVRMNYLRNRQPAAL